MFPITALNEGVVDNLNGQWIILNDINVFVKTIRAISGLDHDDVVQIHRFLMQYYVTTHQQKVIEWALENRIHRRFKIKSDIISAALSELYFIDIESLLVKLSNNKPIIEESKTLFHLCTYLVHNTIGTGHGMTNYHLIDEIYEEIADILSDVGLGEWWCSECCNRHKLITIFNAMLKPDDKMMQQCIVCGC
eukprot:828251_1